MAATNFSASNFFRITDSPSISISTSSLILMVAWNKPTTPTGLHNIFALAETTSASFHYSMLQRQSDNKISVRARSNTSYLGDVVSSNSVNYDAWNLMGVLSPVHDGGSNQFYTYLNGTRTNAAKTTQNYTATLDTIYVGYLASASLAADKISHCAIFTPADLATADSIMASLASTPPKSIGGVLNAWDLIADANADAGSANLATQGSPTFDSDDPYAAPPAASFVPRVCIY